MPLACACPSCPLHRTAFWPRWVFQVRRTVHLRIVHPKIREAKMRAFDYASPTKKEQVADLLAGSWGDVEVLAGGTDLLSLMKDEITTPKRLVNIKGIEEFHGVHATPDVLPIRALITLAEISLNAQVREQYP